VPELNRFLVDNLAPVLGVNLLLLIVLLVGLVVLAVRLRRATRRYRELVSGVDAGSLKDVLEAHIARVSQAIVRMDEIEELHRSFETASAGGLRHIGLVRFNPFDDTGSDQSFALALLDDRRDGVVVSSLHGRNTTRLYAKPVTDGGSRHALSEEEERAIRLAVEGSDDRHVVERQGADGDASR
jgi:HAMP domain-containing protein